MNCRRLGPVRNRLPQVRAAAPPPSELPPVAASAQPAPRRPFQARAPHRGGLTARDRADSPAFFIVGVRADGERVVLDEAERRGDAQRRRDALARCEGYVAIVVESAGE